VAAVAVTVAATVAIVGLVVFVVSVVFVFVIVIVFVIDAVTIAVASTVTITVTVDVFDVVFVVDVTIAVCVDTIAVIDVTIAVFDVVFVFVVFAAVGFDDVVFVVDVADQRDVHWGVDYWLGRRAWAVGTGRPGGRRARPRLGPSGDRGGTARRATGVARDDGGGVWAWRHAPPPATRRARATVDVAAGGRSGGPTRPLARASQGDATGRH
jgi:hypothetical protein